MKNSRKLILPMIMVGTLLLTSCGKNKEEDYFVTGPYMTGKKAKKEYNAYLSSAPTTLNPTLSQSGENVTHLANLVGTLVMNDNYGILRKELAKSASASSDYKKFEFEIRDDVPWVTSDGSIYSYKGEDQYVKADDFVETARQVLDYTNESEIYYMYTLFIDHAWEYYCYTDMANRIAKGEWAYLKGDYDGQAEKLMEMIEDNSGEPAEHIEGTDIPKIQRFERVGVKASGNKVTYTLNKRAQFFPTMLTYCPYMPTNANFYKEKGKQYYGTGVDNMIYCGPFTLTEFSANAVKYKKNESYFRKDEVHIDTVNYTVVDASTSYKDMREAFDRGDVDGFSLSSKDSTGWEMYITGPDKTGTIQNPYSDLVNSRELDDITYTYHFSLDANRPTGVENKSTFESATYWAEDLKELKSSWTVAEKSAVIENTNAALKIKEVRQLVLDGIDFSVYNEQFELEDNNQYQMNTFTPRGYVFDEESKDYIDYYYEEYANKKGLTGAGYSSPLAEAKALVGPQQYSGVNFLEEDSSSAAFLAKYPWLSLNNLRDNAKLAVQKYNEAYSDKKISFPVVIDYLGSGGIAPDSLANERDVITSWNERANACKISNDAGNPLPHCRALDSSGNMTGAEINYYPYFFMVDNKLSESTAYDNFAKNGYYSIGTWGWVGDYADPLTYMHCYHTNGEMSKMGGNTEPLDNFELSSDKSTIVGGSTIFGVYDDMVDDAADIQTSNADRFEAFAEAEYHLLNEVHYIKPTYMPSQGWVASVSRACGYENPSAPYGLADHSLIGIWVLVDVPTGDERKEARELQAEKKATELAKYDNNTINAIYED